MKTFAIIVATVFYGTIIWWLLRAYRDLNRIEKQLTLDKVSSMKDKAD